MPMTLRVGDKDIDNPTWEQVEAAIQSLDGKNQTTISLGDFGKENYLGVGSGKDGRYVVFVTYRNLDCHVLVKPNCTDAEHKFKIGGQAVSYKDRQCHGRQTALQAAKMYLETGDRERSLVWDNS